MVGSPSLSSLWPAAAQLSEWRADGQLMSDQGGDGCRRRSQIAVDSYQMTTKKDYLSRGSQRQGGDKSGAGRNALGGGMAGSFFIWGLCQPGAGTTTHRAWNGGGLAASGNMRLDMRKDSVDRGVVGRPRISWRAEPWPHEASCGAGITISVAKEFSHSQAVWRYQSLSWSCLVE